MIKFKDRIKRLRRGADYENYYTALDIGTEYIKALVVKREGRNGMVLGASRQRQEYADMQGGVPPDVNVKLINSAITSVRIDGFAVNNPIDFQGKQMVITVFNTFAPLTHVGALQTIASELDLELIATVAEPYAMARCAATDEVYDF